METKSITPKTDDRLLLYFLKEAVFGTFESEKGDVKGEDNQTKYVFIILGLILIVATEPYKVLLRRNIGKLSLSLPRTIIAAIIYLLWAIVLFGLVSTGDMEDIKSAVIAGGVFYILFAFLIIIFGAIEYRKGMKKYIENASDLTTHLHRGDSIFFKGKDLQNIWLKTEPRFCFFFGLLLTVLSIFINPFLMFIGLPLFITSLSFWFNEWFQIKNVLNVQTKKIEKEKIKSNQSGLGNEDYNSVSSD